MGLSNLPDTQDRHNGAVRPHSHPSGDFPTYPVGLRLAGRKVLVAGGGHVAQRRVPTLIAAGADVHLVSPQVTPAIEGLVGSGEVTWEQRGFVDGDLDGAWYVMAATDDLEVNERISALAERQRIFCVRTDDADAATAFTPAVGNHDGVTVAVMGSSAADRNPRRSAGVRDGIVAALREGSVASRHHRDRTAGVVLVGGGPGDPELISVAGRKALMEADLVVADRLAPRELLADLPSDTEIIDVAKLPRGRSTTQEQINQIIVARRARGTPGGPLQGRGQLRLRPRLRGGARLPGGRSPRHGDPRHQQPARRTRDGRHPSHAPRSDPRPDDRLGAPAPGAPGLPGAVGCPGQPARHGGVDDGRRERTR